MNVEYYLPGYTGRSYIFLGLSIVIILAVAVSIGACILLAGLIIIRRWVQLYSIPFTSGDYMMLG